MRTFVAGVLFLLSELASAQEIVRTTPGAWAMGFVRVESAGPWAASLELHERTWGMFADQATALIRPAVHRDLSDHLEAAIGGTWVGTPADLGRLDELNGWEQLTFNGGDGAWTWATRVRQEHRWLQDVPNGDWSIRANRIRVRVGMQHGLRQSDWYVAGLVEWWGNQDAAFRAATFSRTWRAVTVGRAFDAGWKLQLTALHQMDALSAGWRISEIGQISLLRTWSQ
jgi:hypothetical protein